MTLTQTRASSFPAPWPSSESPASPPPTAQPAAAPPAFSVLLPVTMISECFNECFIDFSNSLLYLNKITKISITEFLLQISEIVKC